MAKRIYFPDGSHEDFLCPEYPENDMARIVRERLGDDFAEKAAKLPSDKTIAIYCRSGNRSKTAARILVDKGYKVVELASGFNGWVAAGKEVSR